MNKLLFQTQFCEKWYTICKIWKVTTEYCNVNCKLYFLSQNGFSSKQQTTLDTKTNPSHWFQIHPSIINDQNWKFLNFPFILVAVKTQIQFGWEDQDYWEQLHGGSRLDSWGSECGQASCNNKLWTNFCSTFWISLIFPFRFPENSTLQLFWLNLHINWWFYWIKLIKNPFR